MSKHKILFFSLFSFWGAVNTQASDYVLSGSFDSKISNYINNSSSNLGNNFYFQFEQKAKLSKEFSSLNQIRANAMSIENDLQIKNQISKKNSFDTYLGENYLRFQLPSIVTQVGFQEVVWGESFGFNYADIVNPKDNRLTHYADQSQSRIPLLMLNSKIFIASSSIQFLWSPRPTFSKSLPIDLFIGNLITQDKIFISKDPTPKIFKKNDFGMKFSTSFAGIDVSASYLNYLDRNAYYTISSGTISELHLQENHSQINSYLLSGAKTLNDFVLRSDIVLTKNKTFNYFQNTNLSNYKSDTREILLSIDTPTVDKMTGFFIYAKKQQSIIEANSFIPGSQDFIIVKINRNLENESTLELSYTYQLKEAGNGIQGLINWPVNNNTELKLGGEFYYGNENSNLSKLKKINSVFFGLKNYFQL
jgi:hypothetical protein